MTDIPKVDAPTLDKLIEWARGYLERKRALQAVAEDDREHNFALDLWTGLLSTLEELRTRRATDPAEGEQGPMWITLADVNRMMAGCKESTVEKLEVDRKVLEGLLHDSLLWRQDRQTLEKIKLERDHHQRCSVRLADVNVRRAQQLKALLASWSRESEPAGDSHDWMQLWLHGRDLAKPPAFKNPVANRDPAIDAYVMQFPLPEQPVRRVAFADGWDACYMQRPQRARAGHLEVGASEDRREVVINAPFTPDNGSGFVHFAFTPHQAIGLGETLFKKAAECLPESQGGEGARRHPTLLKMALTRAATLRDTPVTNPELSYLVALADEYLAMLGLVKLWQAACTGRNGSQQPCVKHVPEQT